MNKKCLIVNLIAIVVIAFTVTGFAADKKYSVAVLDFESMGTEEYLGKAVSEIMRTALVSNQNYRVVERAQINKALSEQKFQKSGMIDDRSAVEIGKVLGADLIIVGSVVKIGNAYTINSRLIDVKTGEAKLGRNVTGTDLNLLTSMSNELVENLFGIDYQQAKPKRPTDRKMPERALNSSKGQGLTASYMNLDNWEVLSGEWYTKDGAIVGSGGHLILKEEFRDHIFEVTMEHLSGPKSGVGIGTRNSVVPGGQKTFRNNTSTNQGDAFNFTFTKYYNIFSGLSGNWHPINPNWQKYEYQYSDVFDEEINHIRIEAKGKHVKIFVNNRFLVEYSDTGLAVGSPLLWVHDSTERVRFYNIRIINK
jgi:TolB-like protein